MGKMDGYDDLHRWNICSRPGQSDGGLVRRRNLIASFPALSGRNISPTLTADENAAGFDFLPKWRTSSDPAVDPAVPQASDSSRPMTKSVIIVMFLIDVSAPLTQTTGGSHQGG